ncbi:MAG: hypothetical protein WCB68_05710 [Pyrinomonadaceae bacterium]
MRDRFAPDILRIFLCLLLTLTTITVVQAQSGRRSPKPLSPPTPAPTPKESETPAPANKPAEPQQKLIVGMSDMGSTLNIPRYMSEAVWSGFVERFKGISNITISTDRNMSRKDASERAKKETENFVVFLQLETDTVNSDTMLGQAYAEDIVVDYYVYASGTGKVKDHGRVYVRPSRGAISARLPTTRTGEAQLFDAGRETASRVLSAMHKESPAILR